MKRILGVLAGLVLSLAAAQADDIAFSVEVLRMDVDGSVTPVEQGLPGDLIEYRVTATNEGNIIYRPGTVVVNVPIGDAVCYVGGSATPSSDTLRTEFSADGGQSFAEAPVADNGQIVSPEDYENIRWTFKTTFEPGRRELLTYRARVDCVPGPARRSGGNASTSGFTFDRVGILDAGSGYVQVVGEVSSARRYESVAYRVTLYGRVGEILGTDTFIVDAVGPQPRVFDTLVSRVDAAAVADYGLQVEWTR